MSVNPYESSQPASRATSRANAFAALFRKYPRTFISLLVAAFVGSCVAVKEYQIPIMNRDNMWSGPRSVIDLVGLPGVFCMYLAATMTQSHLLAWFAFALGMAAGYGIPGFLLDLLRRETGNAN